MNSRGNGAHGTDFVVGETIVPRDVMNECLERMEKQMEALTSILQGFKEGQWGNAEKSQAGNPNLLGTSAEPASNEQGYDEGVCHHNSQDDWIEEQLVGNQVGWIQGRKRLYECQAITWSGYNTKS